MFTFISKRTPITLKGLYLRFVHLRQSKKVIISISKGSLQFSVLNTISSTTIIIY
jgi:hypothetical protein